jgi:hypothetical protein
MFAFGRWIARRGFPVIALAAAVGYLFFASDAPDKPSSPWASAPAAAAAPAKSDSAVGKLTDQTLEKVGDYAERLGIKGRGPGNLDKANDAFGGAGGD